MESATLSNSEPTETMLDTPVVPSVDPISPQAVDEDGPAAEDAIAILNEEAAEANNDPENDGSFLENDDEDIDEDSDL